LPSLEPPSSIELPSDTDPSKIIESLGLDDVFGGDDRSFRYDINLQNDSRSLQQVNVTVDPAQTSIIVGDAVRTFGKTTKYVNEQVTRESDKPSWWVNPTPSPPPLDPTDEVQRLAVTNDNSQIIVERISDSEISVNFVLDATNPLRPGAPAIDADITIYIREENPEGVAEYRIEGDHDGFPAYELYINQQRVYEHDPVALDQTPWSLFPFSEFDVPSSDYRQIPTILPVTNPFFLKIANGIDTNLTALETLTDDQWSSLFSSNSVPFSSPEDRELQSFSTSESVSVEQSQTIQVEASYDSPQKYSEISATTIESGSILVETNSTQSEPNNFIGEIRNALVPIFRQLSNEDNLTSLENLLFGALGENGLRLVKSEDDIDVTGNLNGDFSVDLSLSSDLPLFERSLSADFGLPWLGLEVADGGTVNTAFNYEFNFAFGLQNGEFFFDVPEEEDLVITLDTSIPDVEFIGNLGFLQFDVTDEDADSNPNNDGSDIDGDGRTPSRVSLGAALDLDFSADTGIEIIDVAPEGKANINLELATSFDDSVVLPSVVTDLEIALDLVKDSEPIIYFRDVGIGLGSFLSSFVAPVLDVVQDVTSTEPLQTIVDLLSEKIPILNMTLIEAAQKLSESGLGEIDPETLEFIKVAAEIINFINSIPVDSENTVISFGDFAVSGSEVQNGGLSNASPLVLGDSTDPFEQLGEQRNNGFWSTLEEEDTRFSFPIFTDSNEVFNLLLGKPADLFELDLPLLGLGFEYESPPIPIFGPLSLVVVGKAGAAANINFGFDTYGLQAFQDSGYSDPTLIAQGLYLSDEPPGNPPEPLDGGRSFALGLGAGIAADVGIDLGVLRASVEAGVAANIYLDLEEDVPGTDRRHVSNFDDLACVFALEGALDAILAAKIRLGFGPFSFRKRITIVRETLVDFRAGCSGEGEEDGAVIEEANVLKLKTTGGNDFIVLSHVGGGAGAETIDVESYSVEFTEIEGEDASEDLTPRGMSSYADITLIKGNGGNGKDRIELDNTVLTSAELKGGGNDDELIGGAGNDLLEGGDGEDYLSGGKGDDELNGGGGDDFIEGGEGDNLIDGKGGFDAVSYVGEEQGIEGELSPDDEGKIFIKRGNGQVDTVINVEQFDLTNHNDSMTGGEKSDDVIDGLDGDDSLKGMGGDDFIIGGLGADTIDGGDEKDGDGTSYINSFAGVEIDLATGFADGGEATGDELISIEHALLSIHDDIARGNEKKNIINGSDGDDVIEGRGGGDELDGGGVRRNGVNSDVDELSYESSSEGVAVSLKDGGGSKGDAKGDKIAFAIEVTSVFNPETRRNEDIFSEDRSPYSTFENLTGSRKDDSKLEGDIGDNEINGLEGNDKLYGDEGNDTLIGGAGNDYFDGGEGEDWVDYSNSLGFVYVDFERNLGLFNDAQGDSFEKSNNKSTAENLCNRPSANFLS
jgi:Ca2+-binding RTX toxin-like protein